MNSVRPDVLAMFAVFVVAMAAPQACSPEPLPPGVRDSEASGAQGVPSAEDASPSTGPTPPGSLGGGLEGDGAAGDGAGTDGAAQPNPGVSTDAGSAAAQSGSDAGGIPTMAPDSDGDAMVEAPATTDAGAVPGDSGAEAPGVDGGVADHGEVTDAGSDASAPPEPDAQVAEPSPSPMLAVYVGNDPSAVSDFESWLGRPVDGVLGYTGDASWEDYDGSVGWAVGLWGELDRRIFWSVPLIPRGATLEQAAAGEYNDHYRRAAQTLAGYRPEDPELHIRTGWEFNGDWFPWAAAGKAEAFVGAFRQFVITFRSVSERFVFEWNVNVGDVGMNPEDAYPGDEYVDIIGMDFYWNTAWDPSDPYEAWDSMVNREWGLQWHQDFAAAHGKPTSYSEWGVMSDAAGPYIERARVWFEQHDVVFHTYWDSNVAFQGKLSGGQYPSAASAFRRELGD